HTVETNGLSIAATLPVQSRARFFRRDISRSPACRAKGSSRRIYLYLYLFSRRASRGRLRRSPALPAVGPLTPGKFRRAPDHRAEWIESESFPLPGRRGRAPECLRTLRNCPQSAHRLR